jgi:competence ComEA-like helix-hairpin-helix protein
MMRAAFRAALLVCLATSAVTLQPQVIFAAVRPAKRPPARKIDINKAQVEDFQKLPGIEPSLARQIVEYRSKHGPFQRVEDLLALKKIGYQKWKSIKPYLKVESSQ